MHFEEYQKYDALGLAALVAKKEVSPLELIETAIGRSEAVNPKINAITYQMYDLAKKSAGDLPKGAFHGVPFFLKDLLGQYKGVPTSGGSAALKNVVATYDTELVKRFKQTGVAFLGKTSCPELGLMGVTEPKAFGATRNPWNLSHTPGGSSGGSASLVAAGVVPMASAGDGGGSIRIPAACCGLFGLKPSRGRVPLGPDYGEVWEGAVQEHVLTRSVRDSAAMLDCVHGAEVTSPYTIKPPTTSFLQALEQPPKKLRIGFTTTSPINSPTDADYKAYTEQAAKQLAAFGHEVEEANPDFDGDLLKMCYLKMYLGQVAVDLHEMAIRLNTTVEKLQVEKTTKILGLLGHSISAFEYAKAKRDWHKFMQKMAVYFQKYDVFMTPTLACPPVQIGELEPSKWEKIGMDIIYTLKAGKLLLKTGLLEKLADEAMKKTPFTIPANLMGLPAMSVPLFWDKQNLPVGIHFMGKMCDESTLFQLARQLEQHYNWFERRPIL